MNERFETTDKGRSNNNSSCSDSRNVNSGSKRNNNRSSNRNSKNKAQRVNKSTRNDPAWYTRYPQLAQDASKFPFSNPLGRKIDYLGKAAQAHKMDPNNPDVPYFKVVGAGNGPSGIMSIKWMPTLGQSTNENSPINIVARELYGFIRHANSGSKNYDAPDLMMYILAMDSIYSFYASMVRVYGVMRLYSGMNRYYPKALVESLGWNFEDVSTNLSRFRWTINQFAYKLTSLYVPYGIDYFTRHIWMNSGVYTDSNNVKAQTYVFRQDRYYKYEASKDTDYRAVLKCIKPSSSKFTVSKAVEFMNSLIDPVLADEDMNIMSGDMLKAFGADKLFTVNPIADDYVVVPTFQPEVLMQIQNMTLFGEPYEASVFATKQVGADIVQIINTDTFTPGIYQSIDWKPYNYDAHVDTNKLNVYAIMMSNKVMSVPSDNPSSDDVLVGTRLANVADTFAIKDDQHYYNKKVPVWFADILSTEVAMSLDIVYVNDQGMHLVDNITEDFFTFGVETADTATAARHVGLITAFNYNPAIKLISFAQGADGTQLPHSWEFLGMLQQVENYTVVESQDLAKLHETALLSLMYVPSVQSKK